VFGLGAGEILVILLMAIVFIGPKKLPELSRSLGKALREFQKTKDAVMESLQNPDDGAGPDDDDSIAANVAVKPKLEESAADEEKAPSNPT
jgi:TatA/E family protein of Tat protein translocase